MANDIVFYVGERPTEPLVVTVTDEATGLPRDLTDYGQVTIEAISGSLPEGITTIADAAGGKVQYNFSLPFEAAEVIIARVRMETAGRVDDSAPFTVTVNDPADAIDTIVTPTQTELWTGVSVSQTDVVRAQGIITLVVGRNVGNLEWFAAISPKDQFWLQQGVAWQAAEHPAGSTVTVSMPYIPGASSISNGDVSVSYFDSASAQSDLLSLAANARLALKRLSWMRPARSVSATPFLGNRLYDADAPFYGEFWSSVR